MARPLAARVRLTAELEAASAIHVGGLDADPEIDLTVAVDGQLRPVVPGTSLAGVLRAACVAAAPDAGSLGEIQRVWGGTPEKRDEPASLVTVDDAPLNLSGPLEFRDGIGIDRFTGATAEHIKYVRQVVPRGSRLSVALTVDIPTDPGQASAAEAVVDRLALLLSGASPLQVGAAVTRGLGDLRTVEDSFAVHRLGFEGVDEILDTLRGGVDITADVLERADHLQPIDAGISIAWHPDGPLMVKAGFEGLAVDSVPLTGVGAGVGADAEAALLIPGSSIKGALRTRAEIILRTLLELDVDPPSPEGSSTRRFLDQLDAPSLELVRWLFGSPGDDRTERDGLAAGRGALSVRDCSSADRFPVALWQDVIGAAREGQDESAALHQALEAAGLRHLQQAFHVAVDRWTGGTAGGLLFSVLEPHAIRWEPIELRLDPNRLPASARTPALCLLALVLMDFARGEIPLGYGVNRGLGSVAVTDVRCRFPAGTVLPNLLQTEVSLEDLLEHLRSHHTEDWEHWLRSAVPTEETV